MVAVSMLAGLTEPQIAGLVNFPHGIDEKTLRKHFRHELDHGSAALQMKIAGNLARIATLQGADRSTVTAGIFMLKARAGWRDGGGINVIPPGGAGGDAGAGGKISPDGQTLTFTLKLGDGAPE